MPHDPAYVAAREDDVPWTLDVEQVFDAQVQADGVPACFAQHALWQARRAACVDDVQPVGAFDGHGFRSHAAIPRALDETLPVPLPGVLVDGIPPLHVALPDESLGGLPLALLDRAFDERSVIQRALGSFDATTRRENELRFRRVDALRQTVGREPAKHNGVHGAQTRGRQHAEDGRRDHGHVYQHDVALAHALFAQYAGEDLHFFQHL